MSGIIDVPDAIAAFREYVGHPHFDPAFVMLTDTCQVSDVDARFRAIVGGVHRSLTLIRHFRQEARSVIYAPQDVAFGMARVLQQVVEPLSHLRFEILRDEAEALSSARQSERSFDALHTALAHAPQTG
ncbi:hypothetical protein [Antarctobacter sp.]|uniref:hypothetical protein n=1 Tax=Antarctobacter sp. TaxID=1872577 RepID=UPI002B26FA98|nr:hypothetical protein [Antarctobacter sp.]